MSKNKVVSICHYVNNVKVEQQVKDGFVNATAMCVAHGKEVKHWLENRETFELFVALINEVDSNRGNSDVSCQGRLSGTKYQKLFPELIFVKQGSPEFGGGTWIHPDLAIQLAQWCNKKFALQVSRWIREWLTKDVSPDSISTDLEQEYLLWCQRHDIRIELKDTLRVELMTVVVDYARHNHLSPYKLCSEVHDAMNRRIQGYRARDIRELGGLPLGDLIRDYFNAKSLVMYSAINRLAKNNILDKNQHPIEAVESACDDYLGKQYVPKPCQIVENVHVQGQRLSKKFRRARQSNVMQLSLFSQDNIV